MTRLRQIVPMLALLVLIPATAMAQRRVPAAESGAIGGEVGLYLPRDENLSSGPVLEGFYEYLLLGPYEHAHRLRMGGAGVRRR